ncbi:MAG: GNAT family N-acetyltransferase [Gudongella sp.]|nr:GNAT family N-acetyltransferase [Gudongella sp.]
MHLEEVKGLPHKIIDKIEGLDNLKVYLVQDFDLKLLKGMVKFGLDIFGDLGMDEWGLVPQIRHGNVYVLTEEGKHQIVGLAILMRDWEDMYKAYLFDYAISEEYQGMGLGFEFLHIIVENLLDQGFDRMGLTVDVDNEPAIRLYRDKIGFEPVLYSIDEYGKGEDRFMMELNIADFLERNKKK